MKSHPLTLLTLATLTTAIPQFPGPAQGGNAPSGFGGSAFPSDSNWSSFLPTATSGFSGFPFSATDSSAWSSFTSANPSAYASWTSAHSTTAPPWAGVTGGANATGYGPGGKGPGGSGGPGGFGEGAYGGAPFGPGGWGPFHSGNVSGPWTSWWGSSGACPPSTWSGWTSGPWGEFIVLGSVVREVAS